MVESEDQRQALIEKSLRLRVVRCNNVVMLA
jgi:hypothetical protein